MDTRIILIIIIATVFVQARSQEDVRCLLPPFPANGKYQVPGALEVRPGETYDSVSFTVTCDPGYRLIGEYFVECMFGEWSSNLPKCVRRGTSTGSCNLPPYPEHGNYTVAGSTNASPGDEADAALLTFKCNPGYELQGGDKSSCYQGIWLSQFPTCVGSTPLTTMCILPQYPEHGHYTVRMKPDAAPGQFLDYALFQVTCKPGYKVNGTDIISCYRGSWVDNFPNCVENNACVLPPYPEFGTYVVLGESNVYPNQEFDSKNLTALFVCNQGYGLVGSGSVTCSKGKWSDPFPTCTRFCQMIPHPSIDYFCLTNEGDKTRECNEYEPPGTAVRPVCKRPHFYYPYQHPLMNCKNGTWDYIAVCTPASCKLEKHPGLEYKCLLSGKDESGTRKCNDYEPPGTIVRPSCSIPNYLPVTVFKLMNCRDGQWDFTPICTADCGKITPNGDQLVSGGQTAKRGELPWHVGVYKKIDEGQQICGGSLVSTTVVISAAHCFWHNIEKVLPASNYAVAAGKLYRMWNHPNDTDAQKSDVKELKVPETFRGSASNYQSDIAIVIVVKSFVYQTFVRPVCVDFERNFDSRQLQATRIGKIAGWGLTAENGESAQILQVVDLPYIQLQRCLELSPPSYQEYITIDKFCAGYTNGTAVCKGDSGGGLVFPETDRGQKRYYLRGIVSTAPTNENMCNVHAITTFTHVRHYHEFIQMNWQ